MADTATTRERPLLCRDSVIRAMLDGTQTQDRRPVQPQPYDGARLIGPEWYEPTVVRKDGEEVPGKPVYGVYDDMGEWGTVSPFGGPGTVLWCREAFDILSFGGGTAHVRYRADGTMAVIGSSKLPGTPKLVRSIHMPRHACRLRLRVQRVWIERLQAISEADAMAEGINAAYPPGGGDWPTYIGGPGGFRWLWNSIYGPDAWDRNDWVWACEFERIQND